MMTAVSPDMTDRQLLRQYVEDRSQEAFAELVRRHVDVVYSAARRQARGNDHLAEDVTQQVFVLLAQKAATLGDEVLIGGWLYNAARLCACDLARKEQRRAIHEQKAAAMADEMRNASAPGVRSDKWDDAEQALDEAMGDLDEKTRGVLVLRYFQGKTAREVASYLGISEEAARKRISRAVDELRDMFVRRGVVVSAAYLAEALAEKSIVHAPAHVVASATSAATSSLASGAAATSGKVIVAAAKIKLLAACVVGAAVVGGAVAGGAKIFRSAPVPRTVALAPAAAPRISGIVYDPAGRALANAELLLAVQGSSVNIYRPAGANIVTATSAADGSYSLPRPNRHFELIVRCDQGFAQISSETIAKTPAAASAIHLLQWGSVKGRVMTGAKPAANVQVGTVEMTAPWGFTTVMRQKQTRTDSDGMFAFERIAPGEVLVSQTDARTNRSIRFGYAVVDAGATANVTIGGSGKAVTGRLLNPPSTQPFAWRLGGRTTTYDSLITPVFRPGSADHVAGETLEQWRAREETFGKSAIGAWAKQWDHSWFIPVNADGSFRIDDLPPGGYALWVGHFKRDLEVNFNDPVATLQQLIVVSSDSTAAGAAQDVGTLALAMTPYLRPGDQATAFDFATLDGVSHNITDYRGKHLLLSFFIPDGSFKQGVQKLQALAGRYGDNVQLLCFSLGSEAQTRAAAEQWPIRSPLAIGNALTVPEDYIGTGVNTLLVDPAGYVVQRHLNEQTAEKRLRKLLGPPATTTTTVVAGR
jgi:RNA polymerase sigma factor (sigma-70 family)